MPALTDPRQESFARYAAQGMTHKQAAIAAGYSAKSASAIGSRLAKKENISQRIKELQTQVAEKVSESAARLIEVEIASRKQRLEALNLRWRLLEQVRAERAADPTMAKVPGGKTGLLVRQIKSVGSGKDQKLIPEFALDIGMLKEIRLHEQQAAMELGEWKPGAGENDGVESSLANQSFTIEIKEAMRPQASRPEESASSRSPVKSDSSSPGREFPVSPVQ